MENEKLTINHLKWYLEKQIKPFKDEIFVPIIDAPGYKISSFGRVKSMGKVVKHNYGGEAIKKEKILSQCVSNKYLVVGLIMKGKLKTFRVSRLVALHFIPNPENKSQVNHIDGDKLNNNAWNLEWNTPSENINHAYKTGLKVGYWLNKSGKDNNFSKEVVQYDLKGNEVNRHGSVMEAERNTGFSQAQISRSCRLNKTYKNFKWEYSQQH